MRALARLRYICAHAFGFPFLSLTGLLSHAVVYTATTQAVPVGDALGNRVEHTGMRDLGKDHPFSTTVACSSYMPGGDRALLASSCPWGSASGRAHSHLPISQGKGSKGRKIPCPPLSAGAGAERTSVVSGPTSKHGTLHPILPLW